MSCRRVEHNLSSVQTKRTPTFWEVAVVTDVHADFADCSVKNWVSTIAWLEIELLPKTFGLWNVLFAVLAEVFTIRINHCRRVVVHARLGDFVHRQHHNHSGFFGDALKTLSGRAIGDVLGVAVILDVLNLTKVRAVKEFLKTDDLGALLGRFVTSRFVLVNHRVF